MHLNGDELDPRATRRYSPSPLRDPAENQLWGYLIRTRYEFAVPPPCHSDRKLVDMSGNQRTVEVA